MAGTTTTGRRERSVGSDAPLAYTVHDLAVQHNALINDFKTSCLMAPAPVIKAGASTLAKTGATATIASVAGVLVNVAASTDLAALTGLTITANKFNVVYFCVNAAGTQSFVSGTEGATLALVVPPTTTSGTAVIAGIYITHSSTFTGGTTALDTATTVYFSTVGHRHAALLASQVGDSSGVAIAASS